MFVSSIIARVVGDIVFDVEKPSARVARGGKFLGHRTGKKNIFLPSFLLGVISHLGISAFCDTQTEIVFG